LRVTRTDRAQGSVQVLHQRRPTRRLLGRESRRRGWRAWDERDRLRADDV
jgi:hypothetical protein